MKNSSGIEHSRPGRCSGMIASRVAGAGLLAMLLLLVSPFSALAGGLTLSPDNATTQPGSAAVYVITVNCRCNVLLGATISPSVSNGPTLSLSSYHLVNGGSANLRADASSSTPLMSYTITVTATDTESGKSQSGTATLVVNDFTVAANPTKASVPAGQVATSTITATGLNGFSGTIYYSDNMPSATTTGLACNLQPARVTLSSSVTSADATLSCSGTPGTYNVVINGSPINGVPVRTATVAITVT